MNETIWREVAYYSGNAESKGGWDICIEAREYISGDAFAPDAVLFKAKIPCFVEVKGVGTFRSVVEFPLQKVFDLNAAFAKARSERVNAQLEADKQVREGLMQQGIIPDTRLRGIGGAPLSRIIGGN